MWYLGEPIMIVNKPPASISSVIPTELYGLSNGQLADPVKGKAITSPEWKSGGMVSATMRTDVPLGGISDIRQTQQSMSKILDQVREGRIFDITA